MIKKIVVDLAPHGVAYFTGDTTSDKSLYSDESYKHMEPYPTVDLYVMEDAPGVSFNEYQRKVVENRADITNPNISLPPVETRIREVLSKTNAKELVFEGEIYTQEQYEQIRRLIQMREEKESQISKLLGKGKVIDAAIATYDVGILSEQASKIRDFYIVSALPALMEKRGYSTGYLQFGALHTDLARLSNSYVRRIVDGLSDYLKKELLAGNKFATFLHDLLLHYLEGRLFIEKTNKAYDILISLREEHEQIVKELDKRLSSVVRLSKIMPIDIGIILEEIVKSMLIAKGYYRVVPPEWGGKDEVEIAGQRYSSKDFEKSFLLHKK